MIKFWRKLILVFVLYSGSTRFENTKTETKTEITKPKMELVVEPDVYSPSIDENGNYVDKIPSFHRKGLSCPCGARKGKVYESHGTFATHIKTKNHQKWLENLNLNKANYYVENEGLKVVVQNQRMMIAKLEKDLQNRNMTVDLLTQQVYKTNYKTVNNLLDLDF
jgi:hypothetical protein